MPENGSNLTLLTLSSPAGVHALGVVAANLLQLAGQVTLMVNQAGLIELVPPNEVMLDGLPVPEALSKLLEQVYNDDQLKRYLQGRAVRAANALQAGRRQVVAPEGDQHG